MKTIECERIRIAALAIADGEQPEMSEVEIESHIANCEGCRQELEGLAVLGRMFDTHQRPQQSVDLWPRIQDHLPELKPVRTVSSDWRVLLVTALLLASYKIIELGSDRDFGMLLRLAPLVVAITLFIALKNNPFTINSGLRLEGELLS